MCPSSQAGIHVGRTCGGMQCRNRLVHGDGQYHSNESMSSCFTSIWPGLMIDPNTPNTIYQNLPPPNPTPHFSISFNSRLSSRRFLTLTITIPIQEPRSKTSPPTPIPPRETSSSPSFSPRFLCGNSISLRWISWILDEMVSRLARSMGLGSDVHSRREKVVDSSCLTCLLGITGCYISSWMESTTSQSKAS
jgi:hypothetical protein